MSNKEVTTLGGENAESDCEKKKVRCKSLNIDGTKYRTTLTKKYEKRKKYEIPDFNQVNSVIPGTVQELFVKEGDVVQEGETVLILEAMKMFTRILMPFTGTVKNMAVKVGDSIPKNRLMFEIE